MNANIIVYYSDDEPLSNSSLSFEYPDQIITSSPIQENTVFKKRILLDSDDITTLKLKQKNSLSSSTSSIVPCKPPTSSALSSSTSSMTQQSKQIASSPYTQPSTKPNRPKKKSKQAKYPRSEGPSDESSDSSSDELKCVLPSCSPSPPFHTLLQFLSRITRLVSA